jgi:hypothetical protein
MCPHNEVKTIAARSGEWWWCEDCGSLRDPQGRWFKSRKTARVAVALKDDPKPAGIVTRVGPPEGPAQVTRPATDPMTPNAQEDA